MHNQPQPGTINLMFGIPLQDFIIDIVMGVPASIGMIYAALTVGKEGI